VYTPYTLWGGGERGEGLVLGVWIFLGNSNRENGRKELSRTKGGRRTDFGGLRSSIKDYTAIGVSKRSGAKRKIGGKPSGEMVTGKIWLCRWGRQKLSIAGNNRTKNITKARETREEGGEEGGLKHSYRLH